MSEFKIGDKVKILANSNFSENKVGDIGTVTLDNSSNSGRVRVKVDGNPTDNNWTLPYEIELVNKKRKRKLKNLKQFHELQDGVNYRLLHGGERDHGYDYELKKGTLYNTSKSRASSVPFNISTRFLETAKSVFKFESLDHEVAFRDNGIKVGCQNLSIKDAKEIAFQILDRY